MVLVLVLAIKTAAPDCDFQFRIIEFDYEEIETGGGRAGAGGDEAHSDEHASVVDQGPGHLDEDSGEFSLREDQRDVGPAQ